MEKIKLTGRQYLVLIAVISMYFFAPTQSIISSVLAEIGATYVDVTPAGLTYLVSINNLCAVFTALMFSFLAGRKLSYKTIGIIALICFTIGGGLPAVLPDSTPFWIMLLTRAIMGLGRGCFVPIVQVVFVDMFHNETQRSTMFGVGSIFFNIGATIGTTIAGALGLINWRMCFIFYLFAIIPLVLFTVFFKEPVSSQELKREKIHLPGIAWAFFLLYTAAIIASQMLWNYSSSIMSVMGINTLEVGTILSMFTIAAAILAVAFVLVYRIFKMHSVAFGLAVEGLGFLIMFLGTVNPDIALPLFYTGSFLIGFGCNAVTLGVPMIMSVTVPAAAITAALGLSEVFHNVGAFVSSPLSQAVFAVGGDSFPLKDIFMVTSIFAFIAAAVAIFVGSRAKDNAIRREADDEAKKQRDFLFARCGYPHGENQPL